MSTFLTSVFELPMAKYCVCHCCKFFEHNYICFVLLFSLRFLLCSRFIVHILLRRNRQFMTGCDYNKQPIIIIIILQ